MNDSSPSSAMTPPARPAMSRRVQAGIFGGALVVGLVLVGVAQRNVRREVTELEQQLASEKKRQAEFGEVKAHADQYRRLLQELEMQINVIQYLWRGLVTPSMVLNDLGKVAGRTHDVILTSLTIERERVVLSGNSPAEAAARNFVARLEQVGNFSHVQLHPGSKDQVRDARAYAFTIDCVYSPPPPVAAPEKPEAPSGKSPASRAAPE